MKIFMATKFSDLSTTIVIEKDDDHKIVLNGEPCNELIPMYGCKLNDVEEERLKAWINENKETNEI